MFRILKGFPIKGKNKIFIPPNSFNKMMKNMKMNAEQVTDMAVEYLKKAGYYWIKVGKIILDEKTNTWKVIVDVGATTPSYKTITIDDNNEKITGYE